MGTTAETADNQRKLKDQNLEMDKCEKDIQNVSQQMAKYRAREEEEKGEQTTCDRVAANSRKRAKKVSEEMAEKEVEIQNLNNEIARVSVDSLNTKAHIQMLKDRLKQLSDDLSEREQLIEQYEQEIRKRNHQLEKKQLYVDRLNREYDDKRTKLELEAGDGDVAGPQEIKIKHMRKNIADLTKECNDMQKDWIGKQTQLLTIASDTDRLKSQLNDQKNRKMVLEQKRIRCEGQLESQKSAQEPAERPKKQEDGIRAEKNSVRRAAGIS